MTTMRSTNRRLLAVKELNRPFSGPTDEEFKKLKDLLRHIKGSLHPEMALRSSNTRPAKLGRMPFHEKSTSGTCCFFSIAQCTLCSPCRVCMRYLPGRYVFVIGTSTAEALHVRTCVVETKFLSQLNIIMTTATSFGTTPANTLDTTKKTRHTQARYLLYGCAFCRVGIIKLCKVCGELRPMFSRSLSTPMFFCGT